jgi:hypothetical protein
VGEARAITGTASLAGVLHAARAPAPRCAWHRPPQRTWRDDVKQQQVPLRRLRVAVAGRHEPRRRQRLQQPLPVLRSRRQRGLPVALARAAQLRQRDGPGHGPRVAQRGQAVRLKHAQPLLRLQGFAGAVQRRRQRIPELQRQAAGHAQAPQQRRGRTRAARLEGVAARLRLSDLRASHAAGMKWRDCQRCAGRTNSRGRCMRQRITQNARRPGTHQHTRTRTS